jgi:hypothetical protein
MPSVGGIAPYCTLAALQGVLVVLPRPAGSARWSRLRSPGWALILPGALITGTFLVLAVPQSATGLALLAAIATPILVALAVLGVVRGSRPVWLAALPLLGASAVTFHSWPATLAASVLTGLGCLSLGAALVRLTPLPWLGAGILAMCVVDVTLLATGIGQPGAALLASALSHSPFPAFDHAQLGPITEDYPDLVLAAVLGSVLAGNARQLTAAALVAGLVGANGLFFLVANTLPGTVPLGVAAAVGALLERRAATRRRPSPIAESPPPIRRPLMTQRGHPALARAATEMK